MKALYRARVLFDAACAALGAAFVFAQMSAVALALGACTTGQTTATSGTASPPDAQQQAQADPNKQRKPEPKGY